MIKIKEFQIGVKAIILNQDKILFIKRSKKYGEIEGYWDIPGGRIKFGEEPSIGLKREIVEETGLELKEIVTILDASTVYKNDEKHIVRITYLCKVIDDLIDISHEHTDAIWVNLKSINFKLKDKLIEKCIKLLTKSL